MIDFSTEIEPEDLGPCGFCDEQAAGECDNCDKAACSDHLHWGYLLGTGESEYCEGCIEGVRDD